MDFQYVSAKYNYKQRKTLRIKKNVTLWQHLKGDAELHRALRCSHINNIIIVLRVPTYDMIMIACHTSKMKPWRFPARAMFFLPWYLSILWMQLNKNKRGREMKKRRERREKNKYTNVSKSGAYWTWGVFAYGAKSPVFSSNRSYGLPKPHYLKEIHLRWFIQLMSCLNHKHVIRSIWQQNVLTRILFYSRFRCQ